MTYTREQHSAYMRGWRTRNREKVKESNRKYREVNRDKKNDHNREYSRKKLSVVNALKDKCNECGDTENLLFHHTDPSTKDFQISRFSVKQPEKLSPEILKCVVMCRSCHITLHNKLRKRR